MWAGIAIGIGLGLICVGGGAVFGAVWAWRRAGDIAEPRLIGDQVRLCLRLGRSPIDSNRMELFPVEEATERLRELL